MAGECLDGNQAGYRCPSAESRIPVLRPLALKDAPAEVKGRFVAHSPKGALGESDA
ncbi:hypothetical protein GCM10009754_16520 [Amycolatopsis minnesotensis]|uniref:Uncharacterized protein n=1 Tax=Amycolatopsis minnesotensis TaxID=337894 RepID=A0ABP5BME4_9PSEU